MFREICLKVLIKSLLSMQKRNEYLKMGWKENSTGEKKKTQFLRGPTLAGRVVESFRGYLGHT